MSNFTSKNNPKEISETTVHIHTHEIRNHFQAQSYTHYIAEVKCRSQEVETFLPALSFGGLPLILNEYITYGTHFLPPGRGQTTLLKMWNLGKILNKSEKILFDSV